jgi:hypothetical protein
MNTALSYWERREPNAIIQEIFPRRKKSSRLEESSTEARVAVPKLAKMVISRLFVN